jgi:hypothetical protein
MAKKKTNPYHVNYYSLNHGGVSILPVAVIYNVRFCRLDYAAKTVLSYIAAQYSGFNNGDLCATLSIFKNYGFKSQDTLTRSIKALIKEGLIELTRAGGKDWNTGGNLPSLYALTWQPIDECKGKLDVKSTTKPAVDFLSEFRNASNG